MKVNESNGRYWLGDHAHLLGMQGCMPEWWRQWNGLGGQNRPFNQQWQNSFEKYYGGNKKLWAEHQLKLLMRTGVGLLTQWTDVGLALDARKQGIEWVPVLCGPVPTKKWVNDGADIEVGVSMVREACVDLRKKLEFVGTSPEEALSGVMDWQEPIWDALRYGAVYGTDGLRLAERLFPQCAEVIREELPGVPVWSPKLAGSTEKDHMGYGWVGFKGDLVGDKSYRWPLLTSASEGRDVLSLNCYGDRESHRLEDQHRWADKPIAITEFSHWVLSRKQNALRYADYKVFNRKIRFTHADSTEESIAAVKRDLLHDAKAPYIVASCIYQWAYHAWDWGWGEGTPLWGYLGHAVDVTDRDRLSGKEKRNYDWMDGVSEAIWEASNLAQRLRGAG